MVFPTHTPHPCAITPMLIENHTGGYYCFSMCTNVVGSACPLEKCTQHTTPKRGEIWVRGKISTEVYTHARTHPHAYKQMYSSCQARGCRRGDGGYRVFNGKVSHCYACTATFPYTRQWSPSYIRRREMRAQKDEPLLQLSMFPGVAMDGTRPRTRKVDFLGVIAPLCDTNDPCQISDLCAYSRLNGTRMSSNALRHV